MTVLVMYSLCDRWEDSYTSMLQYPDGEWRRYDLWNDHYRDETPDAKMKNYWLFEWESSIIFSLIGYTI